MGNKYQACINAFTIGVTLAKCCDFWSLLSANTNIGLVCHDDILSSLKWLIGFEYFLVVKGENTEKKKTIHNLSIKEGSLYVFVMLRSPERPT